jgi:signal transduction histidine kinase/CheY-like chemotaxis protein
MALLQFQPKFPSRFCLGALLLLLLNLAAPSTFATTIPEGKVQMVNAIMMNMRWPGEERFGEFIVGMYGRDPELMRVLQRDLGKYSVRGKRLRAVQYQSLYAAREAHVLLMSNSKNDRLFDANRLLRQSGTLIITDDHDDRGSVMINFVYPSSNRLSFELNRSNVIYEGLQLSKEILLFGGTELDVAELYRETEAKLQKVVTQARKQQEKLRAQQELLGKQEKKIVDKERELGALEKNLGEIQSNLNQSEQRLATNIAKLSAKEALLQEKEAILAEKEASIEGYSQKIEQNQTLLAAQLQQLQMQEQSIAEKNAVLNEQVGVIRNQQFILVAAGGVILLVIALVSLIYRNYRAKNRANLMLERKTQALQDTMGELSRAQSQLLESKAMVAKHLSSIADFARNLDFEDNYTPLALEANTGEASTDEVLQIIVDGINNTSRTLMEDHKKLVQAEHELNELNSMLEQKVRNRTAQLQEANEKLVQLTEAKSQFLSTMSHEIRTPLNGVLGMVELLKDTSLTAQQGRYLETIHTSGEVLLSVINDILDFSKIEAGKMTIEKVEFDLEQLIYGCADIFALRTHDDLTFATHIPPSLNTRLKGDPTRIRQVVLNLLSNAFKFTESGEIRLFAGEVECENGESRFHISVKDTGTGLSPEQCRNIFSAFTQADTSTTRRYGGTGLGLAISQRLAALMGGELHVKSKLGQGSTFSLTLPMVEVEEATEVFSQPLKGHNLLLLDPTGEHELLLEHVDAWGMHSEITRNAADTVSRMQNHPMHLILLSEQVGDQSGLEVARALRQHVSCPPLMLLSSSPMSPQMLKDSGLAGVMETPLAPSRLHNVLMQQFLNIPKTVAASEATVADKSSRFGNLRVLVAEDNQVNQMVIKGLLKKFGITPVIANNGIEALTSYEESLETVPHGFDIILMDCEMPEMDGLEATRRIREIEHDNAENYTPIVALTAHAMDEHRQQVINAGMDAHLAKPLKADALEQTLEKYCERADFSSE